MSKSVRVFACGGASLNIVGPLLSLPQDQRDPGFAKLDIALLDTSRSNLPNVAHVEDHFYHVEGRGEDKTDGSGKVRATNLKATQSAAPDILHRFEPGHLNIVVSSGSGGSGNVISAVLTSELLARGENVVVIMVGSTTCTREIKNMMDTIKSYQSIAQLREKPVVCYYLENSKTLSMSAVDDFARAAILLLASIWSGENRGLDQMDLENFLNYQKVTKYPVGIVGLGISDASEPIVQEKGQPISTVVTMVASKDESIDPGITVGYHSFGEFSTDALAKVGIPTPIHIYTVQGFFTPILERLDQHHAEGEEHYRVNPVTVIKVTDIATDDGLIV